MEYQAAVDFIHGLGVFGSKPGLERVSRLLELLDNPHQNLKVVHIAGTNGKGSTSANIAGILQEAGYKTGLFTSPFIESFNERIQINRQPIPEDELGGLVERIIPLCKQLEQEPIGHPTQFEINTALAFYYFAQENVDIVVLEVGLGGTYDATNVISQPELGIITTIGLDHQAILGDTLAKIASEKAGIIKEGMTLLTGVSEEEPFAVIKEQVENKNGQLLRLGTDFSTSKRSAVLSSQSFTYTGINGTEHQVDIKLNGIHQVANAAVAIAAIEYLVKKGYQISWADIANGLASVVWPGRMEVMSKRPLVILDGAHNSHGTAALRKSILELQNNRRIVAVIGILKDKDYTEMIQDIATLADQVIITAPDYYRAINTELLVNEAKMHCSTVYEIKKVSEAVKKALQLVNDDDMLLITGSLYTIGEARAWLKKNI